MGNATFVHYGFSMKKLARERKRVSMETGCDVIKVETSILVKSSNPRDSWVFFLIHLFLILISSHTAI